MCAAVMAGPALAFEPTNGALGMQPAATRIAERIHHFHNFVLVIITVITILVLALLLWVIVRHNRRANPNPRKFSHNTLIEVIWTVGPVVILLFIAVPSFSLLTAQYTPPEEPALTVKATGYQWYWGYEYPDENIIFDSYMIEEEDLKPGQPRLLTVDNEIVVPVNKVVKVLITANDVLHAWALPSFGVKRDAVPGRINETWFKADRTGTFYGQCSELCGIKHAFMPITVNVVSQEEYVKWLKEAKQKFAKEELDLNKKVVKRILEGEIK